VVVVLCLGVIIAVSGCGSGDEEQDVQRQARQGVAARKARHAADQRRFRQARRVEAREVRHAARRRARRIAVRERAREAAQAREDARAREEAESEEAETSECDPSYSGACLDPYASDYDCEGGSGDGPSYTGAVAVVGDDHYGLDADGDGYGCE
jgi:hypothetical protein